MKLIITTVLCACLLAAEARGETNSVPSQQGNDPSVGCIEVAFVLGCVAVAGWVIIKLYGKCPRPTDYVDVFIDKSTDGKATWKCVQTNLHLILTVDPIELYRERGDEMAFFKARVVKSAVQAP